MLNSKQKSYKPMRSLSNELFLTDNAPFFERNRLLTAFNYQTSKAITFQMGYLHQFDYKINDETGRDFLVVGFYYELFRKQMDKTGTDGELKDN